MNDERVVADLLTCDAGCGGLMWTLKEYGRVTHKHACPIRRELYCQSHPVCLDVAKAALRAAGFDAYRPDDCPLVNIKPGSLLAGSVRSPGPHRLVPEGGVS